VKVEIVVTTTDPTTSPSYADVYRCHLSQMVEGAAFTSRYALGTPVQTALSAAPFQTRTIVLESYYPVKPNAPLWVRIQREPGDPADTFTHPTGLAMVKVTPLAALAEPYVVQNVRGYNSWPMIQAIGGKLVCVYSRGTAHSINEDVRAVYARTSVDGGKTWTPETIVADTPGYGEVGVGKGLDVNGAMLLWVRRIGKDWNHDLYRTTDGATWTRKPTNIGDVSASAPSLVLDAETGLLSNYYYQRGRGILRCRVVDPDSIFDHPLEWPVSEAVAIGSPIGIDSGNVNATVIGGTHYLAFYSGKAPDTAIWVSVFPAPSHR